jgi:hypothetical protein
MTRLLLWLAAGSALSLAPAGLADKTFSYVDLQPQANQKLLDNFGSGREGNNLASLPKGEQTLEEVRFKIGDGLIHLGSKLLKEEKPDRVNGIEVGKAFARLHLLHATGYGRNEGTPLFVRDDTKIAEYKIYYEDGDTETIPVVYGKDVRDWWFSADDKDVTRSKVAWKGDNEVAKSSQCQIRLYRSTWENPHPAKRVVVIDYVKVGDTPAAPFCVAITLEEK